MEEKIFGDIASLSGYEWNLFRPDERFVSAVVQAKGVPDIVARVVAARSIALEDVDAYLEPKLKSLLPDPYVLKDMDRAAARLARAIEDGHPIGIFGDYDVDGATSSAVLYRFLKSAGCENVSIHIPDRIEEGYGLNEKGISELAANGAKLIVAVDCGITGFKAAEFAASQGIEIVIADHHEAEVGLPAAAAVVDPKRLDDDSGLGHLAACGVVFMLCVATNKVLRESGYYVQRGQDPPDLMSSLDLVAFGTVCDVVPLRGVNRAFVSQGLKVLAARKNLGLKALCDISGVKSMPSSFHLGYALGPRVNAGGRVGDSALGARLLTTDDKAEAAILAERLNNFNTERKEIEDKVSLAAQDLAETSLAENGSFVFISGRGWHTGVIGIIAGRLKERLNVPVFVATVDDRGIANGSARSVAGIDIGAAIIKAKEEGVLVDGGGHAAAAGFTLKEDSIPKLKAFLAEYMEKATGGKRVKPTLRIDSVVDIPGMNLHLLSELARLEPFGAGNEEPRFAVLSARLTGADALNGGHIRCFFASDNGKSISAICYRAVGTKLGEALLSETGSRFAIAGKVKLNEWNGRKNVQFVIDDAAPAAA